MSVVQVVGRDIERSLRIEDHEVSVVARGDLPFATAATGKPCRRLSHPARNIAQLEAKTASLGPQDGQPNGEAGDASPSRTKASFFQPLHLWRTRRMVGRYQIDHAFPQRLPELLAVCTAADGRSALM